MRSFKYGHKAFTFYEDGTYIGGSSNRPNLLQWKINEDGALVFRYTTHENWMLFFGIDSVVDSEHISAAVSAWYNEIIFYDEVDSVLTSSPILNNTEENKYEQEH